MRAMSAVEANSGSLELGAAYPRNREEWRRSFAPEERARLAELHRPTVWTRAKALVLLAIWIACAVVAVSVDSLWVRLPMWLVIGFALHGLAVLMHEAAHRTFFRDPRLDRIAGFFLGLPVFFSCSCYRATHMLHHQYENTALDPDNLATAFKTRWLRHVVFYGWFLIGTPGYIIYVTLIAPFRARGIQDKIACVAEPLLTVAFYAALFALAGRYHFGDVVANGWAWALPFTVAIANIRGLAEHTQISQETPPDPIRSTRSLTSNRFVSFFLNNQNYHLEHHLFPSMPWDNLPKVRALMRPLYDKHQASVANGYASWLINAWRYGPDGALRYRDGRAYPET
jgi:fatty acid desaturase